MANTGSKSRQRLTALARIVREVDSAPDLDTALRLLVRHTRDLMGADVCTVYVTEEAERRHVVAATDGLSSQVVGNLRIGFGKGLIGRVAGSRQPVNLDRVPQGPDQDFLLQAGFGPYQGFLGVPILHKAVVEGVLLIRQREARRFDDADEALLSTLAAQLGGAIAFARASGEWCRACRPDDSSPHTIEGLTGAPGLAIGHGVAVFGARDIKSVPERIVEDIQSEEAKLHVAISAVRAETVALSSDLAGTLSAADRALFDAYALLLDSPEISESAVSLVQQGNWAPGAMSRTIETYATRFEAMEDLYLRERAADIRALGARILARLLGDSASPTTGQKATVLVGQRLSAIDIGQARSGNLVGIVSGDGSSLSHAAILARSLGIPAVMGVDDLPLAQLDGQELVVDGSGGRVHAHPSSDVRQVFEALIESQRAQSEALEQVRTLDAVTLDGVEVRLYVNAGLNADLGLAATAGSSGIGLFRSELPFMLFDRFPSELEQRNLYRQALEAMAPSPVTLRTLDAGGDKKLPYLPDEDSDPVLGSRGIRFSLEHPEIFLTQLRAALGADLGLGNLRLLLPMISDLDELEQALDLIAQAVAQLANEDFAVSRPPVGVMIEVPAAVYAAEQLARHADFLSVGTNDLAQYLLATDRNNPRDSTRLGPAHPALLRALQQVVDSTHKTGKTVTVCGEIASDPAMGLLLLGMGFDGLSVSPVALPQVKWAVRGTTLARMRSLAIDALGCDRSGDLLELLDATRLDIGLERLAGPSNGHPERSPAGMIQLHATTPRTA